MGLAIPAGGCLIATAIWFFRSIGMETSSLEPAFPLVMIVVAYLMISEVHYPDFKGKGEKIFLASKVFAVLFFAAILFLGREAIVSAVLFAVFSTYSVFGLFNFSLSLLFRK